MMDKWSRRAFLGATLQGAVLVSGCDRGNQDRTPPSSLQASDPSAALHFSEEQRGFLEMAMDEIVPAGGGMPSASGIGALDYLEKIAGESAEFKPEIEQCIALAEEASRRLFDGAFSSLTHEERIEVHTELDTGEEPNPFGTMRDAIYEAYYMDPGVLASLNYEFYGTAEGEMVMAPFDESLLESVRAMPRLYREAG